ncbi:MAG TPA: hypothetical protein VNA69_07595 [Thermoanaerobaculia bacterium]|nr:hypothetical protein [Thermoanaerobaculia bacterium]
MNLGEWDEGKVILNEYSRLNTRLQKPVYTSADKQAIIASLEKLGLERSEGARVRRSAIRQKRGLSAQRMRRSRVLRPKPSEFRIFHFPIRSYKRSARRCQPTVHAEPFVLK